MQVRIPATVLVAFSLMAPAIPAQTTDGGITATGLPNNALTAAEKADGYELLWNGKDFTGWALNNDKVNPGNPDAAANWAIVSLKGLESGDRHKSALPDSNMIEVNSEGASLFTKDATFQNFDWKVEWQAVVNLKGNAGLLYYYQISAGTDNNASATEYQLCNSHFVDEWNSLLNTAGCNYFMTPLLPARKNPDQSPNWLRKEGSWNQSRIISYNGRVAHYGNGLRLLEYQKGSPAYETAYKVSKYKTFPVYRTIHAGSLFIQDHGQKWMKFRNIRVKRLGPAENPWGPNSPYRNTASGKDSTLLDTLAFDRNLDFKTAPDAPFAIAPKVGSRIQASRDGLLVELSEPGDYTLTLEDVRGARYSVHRIRASDHIFLPGRFAGTPKILSIRKGEKIIREALVGTP